ncbi:hypothetical protein [uncultured Pseudodesulfovibrio sp.]|uniref:hypothetical protein n=1 Tax=uncultured Pseudodesulfovibrio sp. TaxID=2035858 RepID=UPI0029C89227|nr:hypothetical protein [uncultured Pseudodesulfovibrio sp.]
MEREIAIRRLAFIKYLLGVATSQSLQPEPLCSSAILSFHDSIELFLHLCAEELGVNVNNASFLDYWEKLNPKLLKRNKPELTQKESMRRLNKSRVALKHHGTLPALLDIESYRVIANTFFDEGCRTVFGINADDISLIELVTNERSKKYLKNAVTRFEEGDSFETLSNLAIAFDVLIHDYENSKNEQRSFQSPFFFGESMTFESSFFLGIDEFGSSKLGNFVDKVKNSIEAMQGAVKILSFGIDYKRYARFNMIVPNVTWTIDGTPHVYVNKEKISEEEFNYAYNFIIESALKLQEFDYQVHREV